MLYWALSHLSLPFQAFLAPFLSSSLSLPGYLSLLLQVPSPAAQALAQPCPVPLIFLLVLQSLCSLTSEFHQPPSLPVSSSSPASKIGLDEQTQFQKETFFGFLS